MWRLPIPSINPVECGFLRIGPLPAMGKPNHQPNTTMLHYSLVFLVIAIIAGVLGFAGIAGTAAGIAKICFFVFLVIWLLALLLGRKAV